MTKAARFALLPIAILQFLMPALPQLGFGQTVGDRVLSDGVSPELPPGIFFAIWGVIFTLYLVYALLCLVRPGHVFTSLAGLLVLAGLGNITWMLSAQLIASEVLNAVLLWPMLAIIWTAAYRLDRIGGFDGTLPRLLICALVGLLSGWLTVAVSISLPSAYRALAGLGATDQVWISLWITLIPAAILAEIFRLRVSKSVWYHVALGWGLTGIVVNTWSRMEIHGLAIATAIVGSIVLLRRLARRATGAGPRLS